MNSNSTFCGNCGGPLRTDAKFCHRCGVDINLYKSVPAIAKPSSLGRGTERSSASTEERIGLLSDKRLQAELEREISAESASCPSTVRQPASANTTRVKDPKSIKSQHFPLIAAAVIIVSASVAILGGVGVINWANHRGFFGKSSLNSSVAAKPNPTAEPNYGYFRSYETGMTTKTQNPERATGTPDGQFAIVQPKGKITFQTKEAFADVEGEDFEVIGQPTNKARYKVSVWDLDENRWQQIGYGVGQGKHDMGHHLVKRSNQIQIENISADPLMIDAVRINRQ